MVDQHDDDLLDMDDNARSVAGGSGFGGFLRTLGVVGFLGCLGGFAFTGFRSGGEPAVEPIYFWAGCAVSMLLMIVGAALRRRAVRDASVQLPRSGRDPVVGGERMVRCGSCGRANPETAERCENCSARLQDA